MIPLERRYLLDEMCNVKLVYFIWLVLSKTSKDVMDATKASAASTTSNQNTATTDKNPRDKYKEQIKETYKGVPDSLEAQSLLSEFKQLSQYPNILSSLMPFTKLIYLSLLLKFFLIFLFNITKYILFLLLNLAGERFSFPPTRFVNAFECLTTKSLDD